MSKWWDEADDKFTEAQRQGYDREMARAMSASEARTEAGVRLAVMRDLFASLPQDEADRWVNMVELQAIAWYREMSW